MNRAKACWFWTWALATGCSANIHEGTNPHGGDGESDDIAAPEPFVVPSEGSPKCELSADCPDGTYCDLGECFQACNTETPCVEGLQCGARGLCVESLADPVDAPIQTQGVALAAGGPVFVARSEREFMVTVASNEGGEPLPYRLEPGAPWIRLDTTRGELEGELVVVGEIDRDQLAGETASATITMFTSQGTVSVPVHVEGDLSGVYQGELEYQTPRAIGRVPLRLELSVTEDGRAALRVQQMYSPTFRTTSTSSPTTWVATDGDDKLTAQLFQAFGRADFGGDAAVLKQDVARTVDFDLARTTGGGLSGTFTETWTGLFPEETTVTGRVQLARLVGKQVEPFEAAAAPEPPVSEVANPRSLEGACSLAHLPCRASSSTADLLQCGREMLKYGYRLENAKLLARASGTPDHTPYEAHYQDVVESCTTELASRAAPWVPPPGAPLQLPACVRPRSLDCAEAAFGLAHTRGDPDGTEGLSRVSEARAALSSLLVNEQLVEVFELPYRSEDTALESKIIASLDAAHSHAVSGLRSLFTPFASAALRDLPRSMARRSDYRALRRAAQLVGRDRLALDEAARVQLRSPDASLSTIKTKYDADSLNLLAILVTLTAAEAEQGAPGSPELGMLGDALTGLTAKSLAMQEAVDSGRAIDPLGEPEGFVAFVYDPTRAGEGTTNYEQLLAAGADVLATASAAEVNARAAIDSFEANKEVLADAVTSLEATMNSQLGEICGVRADVAALPDLEHCGEFGGAVLEAQNAYQAELAGIELAETRISSLGARVEIQAQRLADIQKVRKDALAFVDSKNQVINVISEQQAHIDAARDMMSIAANANVMNGGAPIGVAVASGILTLLRGELEVQKDRLRQAQELRLMASQTQVEYLDGMATIKEMLVGMAELNVELRLAGIRAAGAAIRLGNLDQKRQALLSELELLTEKELDKRANDPMFRILRNTAVHKAIATREAAILWVYRAARAFELELNTPFPAIRDLLVPALRMENVTDFMTCMRSNLGKHRVAYGSAAPFVDELSLRRDVLGITAPVQDDVTKKTISEAEQFQRLLLQPSNLGPDGTVGFKFAMTLEPNGVWSTGLCNDQLRNIQVKLVGDRLGDAQATVRMRHAGSAFMRSCESGRGGEADVVETYSVWMADGNELAAGVNAYADAAGKDAQFFGRPVAASEWEIALPSGSAAPRNRDIDPRNIEDIVLRIEHAGISLGNGPVSFSPACDF